ncbi:MAG: glycoside hydrolase family 15 protein [Bacteroidota bacterium]
MKNSKIHTYDMGIIGNCSYLAYIDTKANVKWLCMPRFDSSFIFGSLLDEKKGGDFYVQPAGKNFSSSQYYIKNTNVLVTEFKSAESSFRVIDFAPRFYQFDRYFKPLMLIRKIEHLSGNPYIRISCKPVGDYGNIVPEIVIASNHLRYLNLDSQVRLTTDIPLSYIIEETSFVLTENKYIVFTYGEPLEAPLVSTAENFLDKTIKYWTNWVKGTSIPNIYQDQVIRSALVLKLNQYEDTGGIIAAGTTSLPEHHLSGRTWDYRFCWMRDTYYTLTAFNNIGHFEELEKYFNYIQNIILNEKERINPLYTITGKPVKIEEHLNLEGYLGNRPVRTGNNATYQVQNDVYGQLLVSLLPLFADKRLDYFDKTKTHHIICWLLNLIEKNIQTPDSGIWEFGNNIQHHLYTMLFHWAGSKAAYKIALLLDDTIMVKQSLEIIKKASWHIEQCYNPVRKVYTQAIGSNQLDASSLQLIIMNYLNPDSQKAKLHLKNHEKELKNKMGLFYRYIFEDELGKPQSSFIICSFWYAESLACVGRLEEALSLLDTLVSMSNHLGLFSEDVDEKGGQWGNFPQTYSHVGLINAVNRIAVKLDKPFFM